jgi:hypothetical protein
MIIADRPGNRAISADSEERRDAALLAARRLVRFGMPVFPARVDEDGNPDRNDTRWARWQRYPADYDVIAGYRPGDAMAAVCGITFDVIDIDPRNGGKFSFNRMSEELGESAPKVYGMAKTPSGGTHLYIAALGIGSHNGFMPGIDLKGGNPEGSGRGFVFIPPTIRPVKGAEGENGILPGGYADKGIRMGTYKWIEPIKAPDGDPSSEEISSYILAAIESQRSTRQTGVHGNRASTDKLRAECIKAESGEQRSSLLRYVHELERKGYDKPDILVLLRQLAADMPVYDAKRPWYPVRGRNPDRELLTLFHRSGRVIPDATDEELSILEGPSVARAVPMGLTPFSEIDRGLSSWLWSRYIAVGDITILDGDAGNGKSLVTLDVGARMTRGRDMPDDSDSTQGAISVLLLAPEDSDRVTAGRLEAAGADMSRVYRPALTLKKKKGRDALAYSGDELVSFPRSVQKLRNWIVAYRIQLVIVDPISAFLGEKVNSNNDASVRQALAPLSAMLSDVGCSAVFVRHYNKDTTLKAAHRGGGSIAFGAVSRIQLVSGEVPEEKATKFDCDGRVFGITQVKNNHLSRRPGYTLAYTIQDSSVVADTDGNMAPCIKWLGELTLSADELAGSEVKTRRGPAPIVQEEIIEVLLSMFEHQEVWDAADAIREIKASGVTANHGTINKAKKSLGIKSVAIRERGKPGTQGWNWVMDVKQGVSDYELYK